MKRRVQVLCGLMALVLVWGMVPVHAQGALPSGLDVEALAEAIPAFYRDHTETAAGLAVAVFNREGVLYEGAFGFADKKNGLPVDAGTVFEWGSVSKLLVWVSVMQLWEKGAVNLEADVQVYLPAAFLTNLRYPQPLTLQHLMNHTGGFQEEIVDLFVDDLARVPTLQQAMQARQPVQIRQPGQLAAYSNWSTALAAMVVERVSGQAFSAYVHQHILHPLGMHNTSLLPDRSDQPAVGQQFALTQGHDPDGRPLPYAPFLIPLYPAGQAISTLDDLAAFGRALLPAAGQPSPLFQQPQTLETLLSPTRMLGDTDVPMNSHGMWWLLYEQPVVGHPGNTSTGSSILLVDPANGTGIAVMTNQVSEQVFNFGLPGLLYGGYGEWAGAKQLPAPSAGLYRQGRTIQQGPLALYGLMSLTWLNGSRGLHPQAAAHRQGMDVVSEPFGELTRVPLAEALWIGLVLISWALALMWALWTLLSGLVRRLRRRPAEGALRRPQMAAAALQVLAALNLVLLMAQVLNWAPASSYSWQFIAFALLGVAFVATLACMVRGWRTLQVTRRQRWGYALSAFTAAAGLLFILYAQLYQFWAV